MLLSVMAGCGGDDELGADVLPLPGGARVEAESYECRPVCRRYVLILDTARTTDQQLKARLAEALVADGWRFRRGITPDHKATDSPDRKLFVSFATAREQLEARREVDWSEKLGSRLREVAQERAPAVALTLSPGDG